MTCVKPKAALYMFPKLDPELYPIDDDQQFAYELLAEQKVLIVQGTGFNWPQPDHFRVVFLPNSDDLIEAIGRIATFLDHYRTRHARRPRRLVDEAVPGRPARRRLVGGGTFARPAAQPGRDPPPRRARDPHHAGRRPRLGARERGRRHCRHVGTDARAVITSPAIDAVIELIGGTGIARELVLEAIGAGKHVVTANKALLAVHGTEIFAAARENGVVVAFEGAVAGGIPIIKALREGLTRTGSNGSPGSSTAPPTSSSRRCARSGSTSRPPSPMRNGSAMPRPTRRSTSAASTPRTRRRS